MDTQTILIWFVIGFISWIVLFYFFEDELTIRDILIALILSFFGGFAFIAALVIITYIYLDSKGIKLNDLLDKRIL